MPCSDLSDSVLAFRYKLHQQYLTEHKGQSSIARSSDIETNLVEQDMSPGMNLWRLFYCSLYSLLNF